mmetsp:Transcript_6049/g.12485  ORF Transcript_6049/g.12485 Transcript_6049/m.12485 type:complete len:211 (-) Transcript_6049:35-667(-)
MGAHSQFRRSLARHCMDLNDDLATYRTIQNDECEPERRKEYRRCNLGNLWSAEFATTVRSPQAEGHETDGSACYKCDDRESQVFARNYEAAIRVIFGLLRILPHPFGGGANHAPVNRAKQPWQTKPQEDVHAVGTGHITYRGVRGEVVQSSRLRGECVWKRGAERDEDDRVARLGDPEDTAKDGGDLLDEKSDQTNVEERGEEAWPASAA